MTTIKAMLHEPSSKQWW